MSLHDLAALIDNLPGYTWIERAACGGFELDELDHYFVDVGHAVSPATIETCRTCPVRLDCLDHAYANNLASGYFGGLSPSKRKALTHQAARALVTGEPTVG